MKKVWASWDLTGNGMTLRNVPNTEALEALQYLYGVWDGFVMHYGLYLNMLDSVDYVGDCLNVGHFDGRYCDECVYLGLTVDAWEPTHDFGGNVEYWDDVKKLIYAQAERRAGSSVLTDF